MRDSSVPRRLEQSGGAGSFNAQAGRDVVVNNPGITAADAIEIAEGVFWKNFLAMGGTAEQVLRERVERFIRDFVGRLQAENPLGLSSMADPDMLKTLYTAQEGYASSGEDDLEGALIDLLVDRAGQQERNLKTLVLNQAIATVPKLTRQQRASLAVIFFVRSSRYVGPLKLSSFYTYTKRYLAPFVEQLSVTYSDFGYMQYAGVGALGLASVLLGDAFYQSGSGYFTKGFRREEVPTPLIPFLDDSEVFIPCLRDPERLQINARESSEVNALSVAKNIPELVEYEDHGRMFEQDIRDDLVAQIPSLELLFSLWKADSMGFAHFDLTAVGIAIGHASQRKVVGDSAPLEEFLN
jgi:hypothetical protein